MIGAVVGAGLDLAEAWLGCALGLLGRLAPPALQMIVHRAGPAVPAEAPERRREATTPQDAVQEAKYWLGPAAAAATPLPDDRETGEPPCTYGHDRVVMLLRDPLCLFVYWELTPTTRSRALRAFARDADGVREVLRIHDVTLAAGDGTSSFFDIQVTPPAEHWYVNVKRQAASFCAEIGLRGGTGRFLPLARSNTITTPRSSPSPDATVRWADVRRPGVSVGGLATPTSPLAAWRPEGVPDPTDDRARSSDVDTPRAR